jgi:hypothetical protein
MKGGWINSYIEGGVAAFCLSSYLTVEKWKLKGRKFKELLN